MGTGGGGIIAETAGVGDHAGIKGLGGQGIQLQTGLHSKLCDHTGTAFKGGINHLHIRDLTAENMVIDAHSFCCQTIAVITDEGSGAAVQDDRQRPFVSTVRDHVHGGTFHKAEESGFVADCVYFLMGEVFQQQMLHADLAAHGIAVRLVVPVDDDRIKCFDLF